MNTAGPGVEDCLKVSLGSSLIEGLADRSVVVGVETCERKKGRQTSGHGLHSWSVASYESWQA